MDLTKAMFVFQQVARVGVNNEMPKELYLARAANGADTWMVCGVFETDDYKYFDTIVHSGFGWKHNTSKVMFDEDTVEEMVKERQFVLVAKSV